MKAAEFNALCQREWMRGSEDGWRGDVIGLTLTGDSLREFAEDMLVDGLASSVVLRIPDTVEADVPGLIADLVANPITRSDVHVTLGDADTATVRYGPGETDTWIITAA